MNKLIPRGKKLLKVRKDLWIEVNEDISELEIKTLKEKYKEEDIEVIMHNLISDSCRKILKKKTSIPKLGSLAMREYHIPTDYRGY